MVYWLGAFSAAARLQAAIDVTREWFTPPVVPENYAQPVRYEVTITGNPASVNFEYNGADRPMFDDGTHGDLIAGDGTWTILFQPNEILSKLTSAWVYRPFIGYVKPAGAGFQLNAFAEIWTSSVGLTSIAPVDSGTQQTEYIINFVASASQLLNFDVVFWSQRFYAVHGDKFDFLNFVEIAGRRGNRGQDDVKNDVLGIGKPALDLTAQFGSSGRLKGYVLYPLSSFYDGGSPGFCHETGHQWINYLSQTPFASGIPHWPKGDVAINVMGVSLSGGVGGEYNYTFSPNGQGGYVVGAGNPINLSTFNSMELYLMGLVPPANVNTFFVLKHQNLNLTVGQTLQPADITLVTVDDVIAAQGPRVPNSTASQKTFRTATVVLSEQLLDPYSMSLYDWFARRVEAKEQLAYAEGFETGTCNPFYLATGGRAVMFSRIKDETPKLGISRLPSGEVSLGFVAKLGIRYQPQASGDLRTWLNEGPVVTASVTTPPGDVPLRITVTPPPASQQSFYRLLLLY